ncbi:uncharacterized protein si:ch211-269k10.4 [Entelurus aequoreus]|uniref:uncharacterized protein si:ch211-269k10.4 n=1 Tax=Entelurus aequoreus TaxID=161455 RepID=UPI002B1DDE1E|nr:uncharacterized protein si:ch211-269k10.4 [Entelurus aequoreus]
MACADFDMDIQEARTAGEDLRTDEGMCKGNSQKVSMLTTYQASHHVLEDDMGPMDSLLRKNTAVLASLQIVSGILSVGLGVILAVNLDMAKSLFTLFRVAHLTGTLYIIAGVVSAMLQKYPALLQVSLVINRGGVVVALVAVSIIITDLTGWNEAEAQYLKMEVLELCMLGLQILVSVVLCFWISKEKRAKLTLIQNK